MTVDALRIEGLEAGGVEADLLTIGDPVMRGGVNNITLTNVELIDPYKGFAALRVTAPPDVIPPYQITFNGAIGGGVPAGQGLVIDAGRTSMFRFSGLHTVGTNIVIAAGVSGIVIDGGGQEKSWTYRIDLKSVGGIFFPEFRSADPQAIHRK